MAIIRFCTSDSDGGIPVRNKIMSFLFLGFLLAMAGWSVLQHGRVSYSYYENRQLAAFPQVTLQTLTDGSAAKALDSYISDHLALREQLLKLDTKLKLSLHMPVVNDIVIAGDTLLPYHAKQLTTYDHEAMQTELSILSLLDSYCKENGIAFLYVAVPEQSSALREKYPAYLADSAYQDRSMQEDFLAGLAERDIAYLDMREALSADWNAYYPKTDHHYNFYGAYETYRQIMLRLQSSGLAVPAVTEVEIAPLHTPFLGSRARKLMGEFQTDDLLYTYTLPSPIPFTRTDCGQPVAASVFDESQSNLYAYYMGGDIAETRICTDRPALLDVLVVGDSFTNALESILYTSFDEMRSLDFRHYTEKSIYAYLDDYHPDVLLLVRDDLSFLLTTGNGALGIGS